jgi:glycerate 2-kinase
MRPETPKPGDPVFERTYNVLIGNNRMALEAAATKTSEFKMKAIIPEDLKQGDVVEVADKVLRTSLNIQANKNEHKPICLLFGGEPTVRMTGSGKGGRNQHLALLLAQMLVGHPGITILCAGTDGTDGPTGAAGAVVDSLTVPAAKAQNIDAVKYTADFDSFNFFEKAGGHIITGPTMTNVMDMIVVLIA